MRRLRAIGFVVMMALVAGSYGWSRLRHEFSVEPASAGLANPPGFAWDTPSHLVSPVMERESHAWIGRTVASFRAAATDGQEYALGDLLAQGPVILTFNKVGCPCSVAAQPLFNQLAVAYPRMRILGVIDAETGPAQMWTKRVRAAYPQLLDPGLNIVRAFGVENSVYVVLLDQSGRVRGYWPGISGPMLQELSARVARLTSTNEAVLDLRDASEDLYSGCPFDLSIQETEQ